MTMKKHKVVAEEQGVQELMPERKLLTKVINKKARKS